MEAAADKGFNWMVCHDGSDISVQALQEVRYSLMDEKKDHMTVAHVWSEEKNEYIDYRFKMDFVKQACDTDCIALPGRYKFVPREMKSADGITAKELLNTMAIENKADICVVGYHGRKGLKADPTVMGSAVQYMSVNASAPVFILKDPIERKQKEGGVFIFGVCTDGSAQSLKAIELICKMKQANDKISVIICEQSNISSYYVKNKVLTMVEDLNCLEATNVTVLPSQQGRRSADIIRDYVMEQAEYIDFIFCGNTGADFSSNDRSKYLGSVSNELICNTKLNVFFLI